MLGTNDAEWRNGTHRRVRVLVADDSGVVRRAVRRILEADGDMEVVAEVSNGADAVRACVETRPDVAVIDVKMPRIDGLRATEEIMGRHPVPIVVFSGVAGPDGPVAGRALRAGAVFVIAKPSPTGVALDIDLVAEELRAKVRLAARVRVVRNAAYVAKMRGATTRPPGLRRPAALLAAPLPEDRSLLVRPIVAVGASTGGPQALSRLLRMLPRDFSGTLLVVQHLSPGYGAELARELGAVSSLPVREASHGEPLRPGSVLLAPGGLHMQYCRGCVRLISGPVIKSHRPSVDVLFDSLLPVARKVHAVLLSGMGEDGVSGMMRLRAAGAETSVQDEASSIVWGMAGAALRRGCARRAAPPETIARLLAAGETAAEGLRRSA